MDSGGYDMILRLKGGANSDAGSPAEPGTKIDENPNLEFSTPLGPFPSKRKRNADDEISPESDGLYSEKIERYCDEVELTIASTRLILADMVKETKIGRRWSDALNTQLDEIMIANRRLGMTGAKILGCWEEQRSELRVAQAHARDLQSDTGVLREKLRQACEDRDQAKSVITSRTSIRTIPPPAEFITIDDDCIMVVSPSGKTNSEAAKSTLKGTPKHTQELLRINSPI